MMQHLQKSASTRVTNSPTYDKLRMLGNTLVAASLIFLLSACTSTSEPSRTRPRRALNPNDDLKVRPTRPTRGTDTNNIRLIVDRLYLPVTGDLSQAWQHTSQKGLPASAIKQWASNGMRIGIANPAALSKILKNLPKHKRPSRMDHLRMNLSLADSTTSIELAPVVPRSIKVQWHDTLGDEDHTLNLPPGRMQFLVDASKQKQGYSVELTPHYHWVKQALTPISPKDRLRAGRIFDSMTLNVELGPDDYLLVAIQPPALKHKPKPEPASEPASAPGREPDNNAPPTSPTAPSAPTNTTQPAPPETFTPFGDENKLKQPNLRLGDLMLKASRMSKPIQILMIVRSPFVVRQKQIQTPSARPIDNNTKATPNTNNPKATDKPDKSETNDLFDRIIKQQKN